MQPAPLHLSAPPLGVEAALVEPGSADYKKRLEDRAKEQGPAERAGNLIFDDTSPYIEPVIFLPNPEASIDASRNRGCLPAVRYMYCIRQSATWTSPHHEAPDAFIQAYEST